ncbi:MAG TPA: PA14 domain-containing protein [Cellvibrio sp.]|nr:PA14 domain-containing protein [Cellvibrio sp.]
MNIQKFLTKNSLFSALIALTVVMILVRITPVTVDPVVKLVISKNRTGITNIHQQRDIEFTREVMVDRLNLLDKSRFSHPTLGNVATYSDDFFVDVDHKITIKKSDNYRFLIGSDDGFSLTIDGKPICEHLGDRPYTVQPCLIFLNEGEHQVHVSYFQGFGNSGFTVEYARGDEKQRWFGEDSDSVKF